ncbi:MAG: hypothetical protein JNJ46_29195 [Myxococcales bacterium]|nr:hypothetical protein [Myxococcales bacterium]
MRTLRFHASFRRLLAVTLPPAFFAGVLFGSPAPSQAKPPKGDGASAGQVAKMVCAGAGSVTVAATDVKLKCDASHRNCDGEIPLRAKNCSQDFLEVVQLEMYEGDRRSFSIDYRPASVVPPGQVWQEKVPWTTSGDVEAVVYFRPTGQRDRSPDSARAKLQVKNPALDAAKLACDKCGGTWGPFGVGKAPACNCKTRDAGKSCRDGNDCQGFCLFQHYDAEGREYGKCSDSDKLSGCFELIDKGAAKRPVKKPPPRKLATCL